MRGQKVGIVWAGTMGNGIAQVCAVAGLSVRSKEMLDRHLERGS
jgi:3-hydroxybutyryl-CoA dehydrogenase